MIENQKPPVNYNIPIPNTSGNYPEVYYVSTPEGPAFLGSGLEINPETGTLSSTGGGIPATPLNTDIYSLADLGNNLILAGGGNGCVFRSVNGGTTWNEGVQVGYTDSVMYSLASGGGNKALAGSWDFSYPFLSADKGQTWGEGEDFDQSEIDSIGFAGGTTVYVGTYGYIHRSDDGGQTWPQSSPFASSSDESDYCISFAFPGEDKVVAGSYDYGFIAYSDDRGQTWGVTDDYILDGAGWIYGLASDGAGKVIAGTYEDGKVFLSTDSGVNWDGGTQLGNATALHSVAFSDGVFYAGTDDLGKIFKSTDLGATWQLFYNPNSLNADVLAITFNQNNEVVAAINNFIVRIPKSYSPYAYCTPQYNNLPVTQPPYNCETAVNTTGVTDFTDAWRDCEAITQFPCVDSSAVTDFSYAWYGCYGITDFPNLNTSSGSNFTYSWGYTGLTSFPELNFSNGSNFSYSWYCCYYLAELPLLDFSKGEDFSYTWYYCEELVNFPLVNVSSGTQFRGAWSACRSLTSFPNLDVSSGTDFSYTWEQCSGLTSFPLLDVSAGTYFRMAWSGCTGLTSFPTLDVSSGTDFSETWSGCNSLTSFPLLDVSSGIDFRQAWFNCTSLTSFPAGMFDSNLATNFTNAWSNCALDQTSVDNILVSLDTAGQSNGTVNINGGTSAAPSATGLSAKASLQGKGWTVITN